MTQRRGKFQRTAAGLVFLALATAACGGSSDSGSPDDSPSPVATSEGAESPSEDTAVSDTGGSSAGSTPVAESRHGGTLRLAVAADPPHLNPVLTTDIAVGQISRLWSEGLTTLDRNLNPEPQLAVEWNISDDGLVYEFSLREGVTWHDGEPFTSADVVFTLTEAIEFLPNASQFAPLIETVEAPDDHTVVVTLLEPFAPLMVSLSDSVTKLIPAHLYSGTDLADNPFNTAPIGTGPYKFSDWSRGETITFERNENYWDAPRPYLDGVIVAVMADDNSRQNALLGGDIDAITHTYLSATSVRPLMESDNVHVVPSNRTPQQTLLFTNTAREPFDDPKLRRALFQAIDRERIGQAAFDGFFDPNVSAIPPAFELFYDEQFNHQDTVPYDPAAAAAAFDAAGDVDLTITMPVNTSLPSAVAMSDVIRAQLGEVGVTVNVEPLESQVFLERLYIERDFDLAYVGYSSFNDPALGVQRAYVCENDPEATYTNPTGYCNAELDDLFMRAQTAPTPEARAELYFEIQQIAIDELPLMNLGTPETYSVISDRFSGWEEEYDMGGASYPNFAHVWVP